MRKRLGFTLTEVLLALGIIGVVAAITVPLLSNSFQSQANQVAFKKMYSSLANGINQITQENGNIMYDCYLDQTYTAHLNECAVFYDTLAKKLGAISKCVGGVANGCEPQYKDMTAILAEGGSTYSTGCACTKNDDLTDKTSYTLPDGSLILSYYSPMHPEFPLFAIDTNGFKKPNRWGYDVFILTLNRNTNNLNNIFITDKYCWIYEKGGKGLKQMLSGN